MLILKNVKSRLLRIVDSAYRSIHLRFMRIVIKQNAPIVNYKSSGIIKHLAKKGDILMIDEPELNLHPANQRRMARLFVRLIKAGIKVFVTTHSDYLIQELNNLIVLGNKFDNRNKIMKKYGYSEDDVLDKNKVRLYIVEENTLKPVLINNLGMEVSSFDREIREMNRIYDDMTVSMDIAYGNN